MRYNTLEVDIKYTMNKLRVLFYSRLPQTKICVENIVKDLESKKEKKNFIVYKKWKC